MPAHFCVFHTNVEHILSSLGVPQLHFIAGFQVKVDVAFFKIDVDRKRQQVVDHDCRCQSESIESAFLAWAILMW